MTTIPNKSLTPDKPLTPIEKLLADKIELQAKCRMRESRLNENFEYIKDNTSTFFISGISSLLFPSGRTKSKPQEQAVAVVGENKQSPENALLSYDNLLTIGRSLVPLAWSIIQPLLIRWAINRAKSMVLGLFSRKKPVTALK